jgi:hypothetical protein
MQYYLRNGFPAGAIDSDIIAHNLESVTKDYDPESGITSRLSRDLVSGDTVEVRNGDSWETVTIIRKTQKPGNMYRVKVNLTDEIKDVSGNNFKTESRFFRGLRDFNKEELLSCIKKYLHSKNFAVNESGKLVFNVISELNESYNKEAAKSFKRLVTKPIIFEELTKYNLRKLSKKHMFTYVPVDSYQFYLVLSPSKGNFFINNYLNFLPCELGEKETLEETIILNGYLKLGDSEEEEEQGKYLYTIINSWSVACLSSGARRIRWLNARMTYSRCFSLRSSWILLPYLFVLVDNLGWKVQS